MRLVVQWRGTTHKHMHHARDYYNPARVARTQGWAPGAAAPNCRGERECPTWARGMEGMGSDKEGSSSRGHWEGGSYDIPFVEEAQSNAWYPDL